MIKRFFLSILLLLSVSQTWAQCKNKVDPSKVMIFINTNNADAEVKAAAVGACNRGEKFIVLPHPKAELIPLYKEERELKSKFKNCEKINSPKCNEINNQYLSLLVKIQKNESMGSELSVQLGETLSSLSESKKVITSMAVSGHDGGGLFSGETGVHMIDRNQLIDTLAKYPEVNQVSSVLLLGCYSGTKSEVYQWSTLFPNIRLIGGYDSSAPLADRPIGHQYITELLKNEKVLLSQKTQKSLEGKLFQIIKSLPHIQSAIYFRPYCSIENSDQYYYSSSDQNKGVTALDISECLQEKTMDEVNNIHKTYSKYLSGVLEPPIDTVKGELRKLYTQARQLEHCLGDNAADVVKKLFNLLFYNGVKLNFSKQYQDDLQLAEKTLAGLNADSLQLYLGSKIEKMRSQLQSYQQQLNEYEKDPVAFELQLKSKQSDLQQQLSEIKNNPEFNELFSRYPDILIAPELPDTSKLNNLFDPLSAKLRDIVSIRSESMKIAKYLQRFDSFRDKLNNEISSLERTIYKNQNEYEKQLKDNGPREIWVPTPQNLKNKSREDLMQNQHRISGLLTYNLVSGKEAATLRWLYGITRDHLTNFSRVPFSWHEYKGGAIEKPKDFIDLSTYLNKNLK